VQTEQHFGGEVSGAPSHTCGQTHSGESYRIERRYESGALKTSWYTTSSGAAMSFYTADVDVDQNTGLASKTRTFRTNPNGTDGIETTYTYDQLAHHGREYRQTEGALRVFAPAAEDHDHGEEGQQCADPAVTLEFDGLGRAILETRSMPNSVTASRRPKYNGWDGRPASPSGARALRRSSRMTRSAG
jgi:hypothetical protein